MAPGEREDKPGVGAAAEGVAVCPHRDFVAVLGHVERKIDAIRPEALARLLAKAAEDVEIGVGERGDELGPPEGSEWQQRNLDVLVVGVALRTDAGIDGVERAVGETIQPGHRGRAE